MGIGLLAIYVLGYTIAQDGVSTSQIGLATGIVGASSYFLSFFSGPLMGFLTTTLGHVAALDIIVVAFEFRPSSSPPAHEGNAEPPPQ